MQVPSPGVWTSRNPILDEIMHACNTRSLLAKQATILLSHTLLAQGSINQSSPQHKHWPTGPAHFSDRRASTGQYIVSFTGPAGPPS